MVFQMPRSLTLTHTNSGSSEVIRIFPEILINLTGNLKPLKVIASIIISSNAEKCKLLIDCMTRLNKTES